MALTLVSGVSLHSAQRVVRLPVYRLVLPYRRAIRATLALLVRRVSKGPKEIRATKGQLEIVAQLVRKVFKDLRVIKVILVLLVHVSTRSKR